MLTVYDPRPKRPSALPLVVAILTIDGLAGWGLWRLAAWLLTHVLGIN